MSLRMAAMPPASLKNPPSMDNYAYFVTRRLNHVASDLTVSDYDGDTRTGDSVECDEGGPDRLVVRNSCKNSGTTGGTQTRQLKRVASDLAVADGDTWTERFTVCERPDKLVVRSYYKNSRTAQRVWGEPPSGASNVKHADDSMRKEADMRLHDLQSTLDMIPTEKNTATPSKKEKSGFIKRFRKKEKKPRDDSKDLNLQRAIARSMKDRRGADSSPHELVVLYNDQQQYQGDGDDEQDDSNNLNLQRAIAHSMKGDDQQQCQGEGDDKEDEALQMTKALSMSESLAQQQEREQQERKQQKEQQEREQQKEQPEWEQQEREQQQEWQEREQQEQEQQEQEQQEREQHEREQQERKQHEQQEQQSNMLMSEEEMVQPAIEMSPLEARGVTYYIPDTQRYSNQAGDFSKDPPGSALDDKIEDGEQEKLCLRDPEIEDGEQEMLCLNDPIVRGATSVAFAHLLDAWELKACDFDKDLMTKATISSPS